MKRQAWLLALFLSWLAHHAQDAHFSQFTEQHAMLNPALTGAVSNLRITAVTRRQWATVSTPFVTQGISAELRSPGRYKRTGKFGRAKKRTPGLFAVGLSVYRDNAGDGSLNTLDANLSLSVFVPTGPNSFLSTGVQATLIQRRIDAGKLIYPDQFTGTGYDPNLIPGENLQAARYSTTDASAGMLWTYGRDIKTFVAHHEAKGRLGVAMYHLMRPTDQFIVSKPETSNFRFVAHGDLLLTIEGTHLAWTPAFQYMVQGPSSNLVASVMLRAYNSNDTKFTGYVRRSTFGLGAGFRNKDAVIFSFLCELEEQYAIGLSYDMNVSALKKAAHKQGAMEVVLRYTPPNSFLYQKK